MPLTETHRRQIIVGYCLIFYVLLMYKLWNGFLLFQLRPYIFNTRFDLLTWLLMQTGLHQWLLNNPAGCLGFDLAFYSMPLLYLLAFYKQSKLASIVATLMLFVNWVYIECYTLYPANSIESFGAWLLFPFLFMTVSLRSFYFVLHALRYFFLFFFASAAIWKFVQYGIFNPDQMSGVLLFQHKEYLVSSPSARYTKFIYWVIHHPGFGYLLYVGATVFELSFIVGFFTKRYDYLLAAIFITFLILDVVFMRIPYWEVSAFILTLLYSKYSMPVSSA